MDLSILPLDSCTANVHGLKESAFVSKALSIIKVSFLHNATSGRIEPCLYILYDSERYIMMNVFYMHDYDCLNAMDWPIDIFRPFMGYAYHDAQ